MLALVAFTTRGGINVFPAHVVLFCPFTAGHRDDMAPHLRGSLGDLPDSVTGGPSLLCVCGRRLAVSGQRGERMSASPQDGGEGLARGSERVGAGPG